jgi:hypothetical protein
VVTRGGFALVYLVLAVVIPPADTSEQRAEAHGQHFNAQELIDQAKKQYASFAASSGWGWRRQQRAVWRAQRRAARWSRWGWTGDWGAAPPAAGPYGGRLVTHMLIPVLSLVSMLLFAAWAFAFYSLVTSGQILGQALPADVPYWVGILALVFLYHMIAWPLHFARRRAVYYAVGGGYYYGMMAAWDGLLTLSFGLFVVWVAYHYIPEIREIIRSIPDVLRSFGVDIGG